jgi:hypothetical protein
MMNSFTVSSKIFQANWIILLYYMKFIRSFSHAFSMNKYNTFTLPIVYIVLILHYMIHNLTNTFQMFLFCIEMYPLISILSKSVLSIVL